MILVPLLWAHPKLEDSIPYTGLKKKKKESNGCHSEIRDIEYDIIKFICFSAVAHYKIDVPMKKKKHSLQSQLMKMNYCISQMFSL